MNKLKLVVVNCPNCNNDIIAIEGDEAFCNIDRGYIKKAYNSEKTFIVAIGGKKGLTVAKINPNQTKIALQKPQGDLFYISI